MSREYQAKWWKWCSRSLTPNGIVCGGDCINIQVFNFQMSFNQMSFNKIWIFHRILQAINHIMSHGGRQLEGHSIDFKHFRLLSAMKLVHRLKYSYLLLSWIFAVGPFIIRHFFFIPNGTSSMNFSSRYHSSWHCKQVITAWTIRQMIINPSFAQQVADASFNRKKLIWSSTGNPEPFYRSIFFLILEQL